MGQHSACFREDPSDGDIHRKGHQNVNELSRSAVKDGQIGQRAQLPLKITFRDDDSSFYSSHSLREHERDI